VKAWLRKKQHRLILNMESHTRQQLASRLLLSGRFQALQHRSEQAYRQLRPNKASAARSK
jgi:hypothetical protein